MIENHGTDDSTGDQFTDDTEICLNSNVLPSVTERYFTVGYQVNLPRGGKLSDFRSSQSNFSDVCILRHSNRVCLVTLAPTHPVIHQQKTVTTISFKVTEKLDRSNNRVSGKRKRGAQWLNPSSPLCLIYCSDGSQYTVYCGVRASLVEMNDRLLSNPDLLLRRYKTEGYISVVMPKLSEASTMMELLLSEEEYQEYRAHQSALETKQSCSPEE